MTAARIREDGSFGGCGEGTEEDEGGGGGAVSQDGVGIGWSQRCRYPSAVAAGACEDDSTKQQLRRDMEQLQREQLRREQLRREQLQREQQQRQLQREQQQREEEERKRLQQQQQQQQQQQRREQQRREEEERKQRQQQLQQLLQAGVSEQAACMFLRVPTTKRNLKPILAILGLSETPFPTGHHIKTLYKGLCRCLHPDKFKGGDSTAVFQKLQQAYNTLTEWMQEREAQREREAHAARNVVNLCSSDEDDLGMCFSVSARARSVRNRSSGGSDGRREEGVGGA